MEKRALCLFSGGLDSLIAVKLMQEQDIECIGISFSSPFFGNNKLSLIARELNIKYINYEVFDDYLDIVKNPKFGYGSALNPCIDCKIYMIKKTKQLLKEYNASFIVSGEVLGQRPMSQNRRSLDIILIEADVEGLLVRPLSAKLLPKTIPEIKGILNREKFYDIQGRGRAKQIELAKKYNLNNFSQPAGGCLLTEKIYSEKLKDLFLFNKTCSITDLYILKYGRHFRIGENKIIVGKNELDNQNLIKYKNKDDLFFNAIDYMGPITILQGPKNDQIIQIACEITASYSDCPLDNICKINCNDQKIIEVKKIDKSNFKKYCLTI